MRQLRISKSITNRESASIEKYLHEIGKVDLLTPDEEVELTKRIRQGDTIALEKLTKANLRFVVSVAKQYQGAGLALSDLINEGNLGLIKAATRFDETRGFKFISYAVWWIRQTIMQALAEQSRIIRLPLNKVGDVRKFNNMFNELEQKFQCEPTPEQIAEALGVDTDEVEVTLGYGIAGNRPVSLDQDVYHDSSESPTLLDMIKNPNAPDTDEELANKESLKSDIAAVLDSLAHERTREVLKLYFGIGVEHAMTLEDIGSAIGLTRERVRQIKDRGLTMLRASSRVALLKKHLG